MNNEPINNKNIYFSCYDVSFIKTVGADAISLPLDINTTKYAPEWSVKSSICLVYLPVLALLVFSHILYHHLDALKVNIQKLNVQRFSVCKKSTKMAFSFTEYGERLD